MDCIICKRKNISASMGGTDICGWCDCGGMIIMGSIAYIRVDALNAYRHILDQIPSEPSPSKAGK